MSLIAVLRRGQTPHLPTVTPALTSTRNARPTSRPPLKPSLPCTQMTPTSRAILRRCGHSHGGQSKLFSQGPPGGTDLASFVYLFNSAQRPRTVLGHELEHELISSSYPPLEVLAFQSLSCRVARTQAATCSMLEGRGGPPELRPRPTMLSWPLAGMPARVFLLISLQRLMGKSREKCHRGIHPALALTDASLPSGCVSPGE